MQLIKKSSVINLYKEKVGSLISRGHTYISIVSRSLDLLNKAKVILLQKIKFIRIINLYICENIFEMDYYVVLRHVFVTL